MNPEQPERCTPPSSCEYPESKEGNWTSIGRCIACGELPPFEYVEAKMRGKR